jgi:hypothetical protein
MHDMRCTTKFADLLKDIGGRVDFRLMRSVTMITAVTIALSIGAARAQTHSVSTWRVAPEVGSFATVITLEVSSPPVVAYRICHARGSATGLAIKINCSPDGRVAPDPTKGCFERPVVPNMCQDVGARESVAIRRYSPSSEDDVGTFELLAVRQ